ncbi:hypothetical protein [Streptomyces botrytidirepellens]|uniref:Uncharacterized protein n=1 Tax=Streptomyces botrytidirepellens TaxID=2486417 RepID=A0A3M8WVL1_9ACTN|nr:hypothetical protein [Streptomyces botrytidirepellens]RNG34212.1 hypothetical protein EEJ42_06155 [Streptomyces botrytidirepellens]
MAQGRIVGAMLELGWTPAQIRRTVARSRAGHGRPGGGTRSSDPAVLNGTSSSRTPARRHPWGAPAVRAWLVTNSR